MIPIASIYIGLLALLGLGLSVAVVRLRIEHRVSLGDGGLKPLRAAMRAHGNFAETAPIGLLIVAASELTGAPGWVVHALGATLLGGRAAHAAALLGGPARLRQVGMAMTYLMFLLGGIGLVGWGALGGALGGA